METRIAPLKNYNKENNTRKCCKCNEWLDLSEFSTRVRYPSSTTKDESKKVPTLYYRSSCKKCSLNSINKDKYHSPKARREKHKKDPRAIMLQGARARARKKGLEFNISRDDVVLTEKCPLLNTPLEVSENYRSDNSPSLDRIDNSKGYVRGNVMVISAKANTIKNNASLEELELIVSNLKRVLYKGDELLER